MKWSLSGARSRAVFWQHGEGLRKEPERMNSQNTRVKFVPLSHFKTHLIVALQRMDEH